MIKKGIAVLLSSSLVLLSFGPECASVLAQEISAAAPVERPGGPVSPLAPGQRLLGAVPSLTSPLQAHSSSLPSLKAPQVSMKAAVSAPSLPKPAIFAAPLAPKAETPFKQMVAALAAPSPIQSLSKQASGDSVSSAGRDDFAIRLGEKPAPAAAAGAVESAPSLLAPAATASRLGRRAVERPQARSAAFPAAVTGVLAGAALAFTAAAAAIPAIAFGAAAAASAARAAAELVSFHRAMKRGEGMTQKRFKDFLRARVIDGALDGGVADLIRADRSERRGFWDARFAYAAGGLIYLRPELAATPALFDKVLAHELEHLRGEKPRGPPRGGFVGRLARHAVSETRARVAELAAGKTLDALRVPVLERALRLSQNSLRFSEPYDVLVVGPASSGLAEKSLYDGLSDGKARVETGAHEALGEAGNAGRFRAVVLANPVELLPPAGSPEAKRLDWSLDKLDEIYRDASRLMAQGAGMKEAEKLGLKRYGDLAETLSKIKASDRQAAGKFEKAVGNVWRSVAGSRMEGLAVGKAVENLYGGMKDKGIAFLRFSPEDRGVLRWHRMLRFWQAADGGRFRVKRVDLEDGGHVIVLRKAEARVGLWLKPVKNGVFAKSVRNVSASEERRAQAREALEKAGYQDYLKRFDDLQVEIQAMYGADVGRQEIYVTVPRRNAQAIQNLVAGPEIEVGGSRADFEPHLMDSAGLQQVPPVWKLGITGKGGTIMLIGTGGDASHGDFAGRLDVIDEVGEGPEDWIGHETHTAGIALSGNASFLGMAREALGLIGKVFRKDHPGAGDGEIKSAAVAGWERADVINLSLGSRGNSGDDLSVFLSDLTLKKNARGEYVVIVASNGNAGPFDRTGSQPAAGENVIAVAAAAKSLDDGVREISFYSSVGPDVDPRFSIKRVRAKPDLSAIGGDVTTKPGVPDVYGEGVTSAKSKDMPRSHSDAPDGAHVRMSGTSMASPMVAGIALLVKLAIRLMGAETPFLKENLPFAVKAILMRTADDLGLPVWFMGAGLVNAAAAVGLVAKTVGWSLRSRLAKAPGLSWVKPSAEANPWAWIESLKALSELEDKVYQGAEIARTETLARVEDEARGGLDNDGETPELRMAAGNAAQAQAVASFNKGREEALSALQEFLKDPVWLVRRNAALVLLNLKTPGAVAALAEAAEKDEDSRVRQAAALALAEVQGSAPRVEGIYGAYVAARRGDLSRVGELAQAASDADKRVRFTAVWLLGQLGDSVTGKEAEALSAKAAAAAERGNIRHLAAAALFNVVAAKPEAFSDKVVTDLLSAAGTQNLALTRTISKIFPEAVGREPIASRLREEPLKTVVTNFVLNNKAAIIKPGALGELVRLLAGHLSIPLDSPTAVPSPAGAAIEGVDPAMGPLDLIVEGSPLDAGLLARYESRVAAELPISRAAWVQVPEHKLYALSQRLLASGYKVRLSQPEYNMVREPEQDLGEGVAVVSAAPEGSSEAKLMAAVEEAAAKKPLVILLSAGGVGSRASAINRLVNRLILRDIGVVVPAGNMGPAKGTLAAPANAGLPVVVGAKADYSSKGAWVSWTEDGTDGKREGTGVSAERAAVKLAALARRLSDGFRAQGEPLPPGWFLYTADAVKNNREPAFDDLGQVRAQAAALAAQAASRYRQDAPLPKVEAGARFSDWKEVKPLKRLLADGDGSEEPFSFKLPTGVWAKARSAGLEGFLYSKLEVERAGAAVEQLEDYFRYLDSLPGLESLKPELAALRASSRTPEEKNRRLNAVLVDTVKELGGRLRELDPSQQGRQAQTYMIFSRAYNRLRPGKDFFDSLDDEELARIKGDSPGVNEIWLMDIFEIGVPNRWGTGGGSSYSIKGYDRIKEELGGMEGLKRLIARAHAAGLKVKVDYIPNHTSLDSEMLERHPEAFLHIVPPQPETGESEAAYRARVLEGTPRESKGGRAPIFYLVRAENYPGGAKWILVHHPRTDYGDDMWVDLAQIDYSRPSAREWQTKVLTGLFTELGVDSVRRDMAYEIVNARFFPRWKAILNKERDSAQGWARQELDRLIWEFWSREKALKGAEFIEQATDSVKKAKPEAYMIDEAYGQAVELSRSGSDGIYNKSDHDTSMGQVGLYDAMVSRDAARIREALKNAAFRRWQRGGAAMVNFIGTHDGGEGNPVDKFGRVYRAAAATALLLRPILLYNGVEQGVGQRAMLIGDLSKSVDTQKAIPFDIPVKINWDAVNPEVQGFHKALLSMSETHRDLLDRGAMQVLEPREGTPVVAYSVGDGKKAVIVAANYSENEASGVFDLASPLLKAFGAFEPRADSTYILRDNAHPGTIYRRTGKDLLEDGLYVKLAGGDAHLFEVEEVSPNVSAAGPPVLSAPAKADSTSWDKWVARLVFLALVPFALLQGPQILANFHNLAADPAKISILPWIGYSTGILANSNLWGFHIDGKRHAVAAVQGAGVLTSTIVLAQIYMAGFMPLAAAIAMAALIAASLAANVLRWTGKLSDKLWSGWNGLAKLLGLFALPMGFSVTFNLMKTHPLGVLAASALLAALGGIAMALEKKGKLPQGALGVWAKLGAWLGTLLFVFLPIPQIVNNFAHPDQIKGLAIGTLLLSTLGNMLETTGAVNAKSQIWFAGSFWAIAVGGWGVLLSMILFGAVSPWLFWSYTLAVPAYLAWMVHQVKTRHQEKSYWQALKFIFLGEA